MAASGGSQICGSLYKGSVEDFDISCEPCKDEGNFVEASGYCQNCDEYLCLACMKIHCLPRPCRHHVVLDKHQMPQNKPRKPKVPLCTVTCDKHPSECLKFFCKKHDVTGCGDCMIMDHRTCKVDYISTLAEDYNTSIEYTSVIQKIDQLQAEVNDKLADAGQTATKAEATINKAIADIKHYRKEVNEYFDNIERTLAAQCDEIKNVNQHESKKICDELNSSSKQLASIHARLTSNIDNTANLLVRTKESHALLKTLENEINAKKNAHFTCVEFATNIPLTSEMSSATSLGELQVTKLTVFTSTQRKRIMDMVPQHKSDISAVDSTDTQRCYIAGIVHVRDSIVACTDWHNKSVKLIGIKQGKLLSTVSVMDQPWDITYISQDTFAVTVPITSSSKIQFLEIKHNILSLKSVIDVNGECRGIDCIDDKLVVSYTKLPKVEIIDIHGKVLKAIQTDTSGCDLFKWPGYVSFSKDGETIYVSDREGQSIIKLTLDGTVQASYKDSDLRSPYGMFVCRDGSLLVCFSWSVHVLSGDCKKQKQIITDKDGVYLPSDITFDEENGILCLSKHGVDDNPDAIQIFIIK